MDLSSSKPSSTIHLVAVPYPGRGHINAMMNFCKILISKTHGVLLIVSFVVTEEWLGLIGSDPKPANIQLVTMPNVVPSERVRGEDMEGFIEAVSTKMGEPFERILDRLQLPATFIVADSIILWVIRAANRRKIPVASLFPMSAMAFDLGQRILEKSERFGVDLSERGDEHSDHNPAHPSTDQKDPPVSTKESSALDRILEAYSWLPKARCLLICTIHELEPQVIDTLRSKFSLPIYAVGPAIPYLELRNGFSSVNTRGESDYFQWLDSKPNQSVLYIALGSFIPVSNEQRDELAAGLREARVPFLWVVRGETQKPEKMCGDLGLMVPWCDQLRVLCHPSIGGFLSHCGWNSIQEGVFAGVPFLTFPLGAEQFLNSKLIADDWKIGYKLYKSETKGDVVLKEEVAALVKKFMDLGCEEGKQNRRRVKELQEQCHGAILEDGSATRDIKTFKRDILTQDYVMTQTTLFYN